MSTFTREKSRFNIVSASPNFSAPGVTGIRAGFSQMSQMSHKVFSVILVGLVLLTGLFVGNMQSSSAANAGPFEDWTCDNYGVLYEEQGKGTTATAPETSISNSIANLVDLANNNRLTAYEMYGTAGTNYTMWHSVDRENLNDTETVKHTPADGSGGTIDTEVPKSSAYWADNWMDCTGALAFSGNAIANVLLSGTEVGVSILNFIYGLAFDGPKFMLAPFYEQVNLVIGDLKETLYLPFAVFFVMIGALWMAYIGLWKKRSIEAGQGALWMIGSAMGGLFLLSNPAVIPDSADQLVGGITAGVGDTLTRNATNSIDNVMCRTGSPLQAFDPMGGTETYLISDTSRKMQCAIWYNLVYTPWVVGQFGASPSGTDATSLGIIGNSKNDDKSSQMASHIPIAFGDGKNISNAEKTWPLIQLNAQALNENILSQGSSDNQMRYVQASGAAVAYQELVVNGGSGNVWNGQETGGRITVAGTSFLAMLCSAVLIILFSLLMITYQVTMVFLMLMMPFFLLMGVHPGMGRKVALRWLELVTNLAIKRIMISILLGVFMLLYALIISSASVWYVSNILILAVTIVGVSHYGKIMKAFAKVDFGGDKKIMPDKGADGAPGFLKKTAGAIAGATVGAVASGSVVKGLAPAAGAMASGPRSVAPVPSVAPTAGGGTTTSSGRAPTPNVGPTPTRSGSLPPIGIPFLNESGTGDDPTVVNPTVSSAILGEEDGLYIPPVVTPTPGATQVTRGTSAEEKERVRKLKRRAIVSGAIQGGAQGATGKLGGAVFKSFVAGVQVGDVVHDNEVVRQDNLQRNEREEARSQRDEAALNEQRAATIAESNARTESARREQERADAETSRRQAAEAAEAQAKLDAEEAAKPRIVPVVPNRNRRSAEDAPSRFNVPDRKTEIDYDAREQAELDRRRNAGKPTSVEPPRVVPPNRNKRSLEDAPSRFNVPDRKTEADLDAREQAELDRRRNAGRSGSGDDNSSQGR